MSAITFATIDAAMAANVRPVRLYVRIGGVAVSATEAHTRHSVDQPVGTCTVYLAAPRPASLAMNAEIEIEAGYAGATRRIFHGFVTDDDSDTDNRGNLVRVDGAGWASRLAYPEPNGIEITGPVSLKDAFRSLCLLREIPTYLADDTTYVDGTTEITLGGNTQVSGGHVRIDSKTSPLAWITRTAKLFGYRVFDSPDGAVRLARISGLPPTAEASVQSYSEGVNCYRLSNTRDRDRMVTYWEVLGARYTDTDGGVTQIRSIPSSVPYDATLDPPGYRKDTLNSQELVTSVQAQGARNAHETDYSELYQEVTWEAAGRPDLQPGDVVTVAGASHGLSSQRLWLTDIDQSVTDRGYLARMAGWFGAGTALAAGNDAVTVSLGSTCYHIGDETVSWYRTTTPNGTSVTIDITVADADYSSLRLTGIAHGCNTYGTGNTGTPTTGSVVEVWQLADPSLPESGSNEKSRKGSVTLPTLDEEYSRQRNYAATDTYWTAFSLPLPGTLKVGAAELRLIAGTNPSGYDDYELDDLALVYAGVGEPTLPGDLG